MENDYLLINDCKDNNPVAFEKLYQKYASRMKGVAFRYVNDYSIAEDIIQESFIKVFLKIKTFDATGSFEGWLHRVVVNASIDYYNKLKKQNETKSNIEYLHTATVDLDDDVEYDFSMEELIETINMLPTGYKLVFNMYVIDNYSHKEIATALGITEGTSKSQLSKAREYLKKILVEKQKIITNEQQGKEVG